MKDKMSILDAILKWAEEQQIKFKREEEGILFPVNGENGSWYTRVCALEEQQMLFIVTGYPFRVPEGAREKTAVELGNITGQLKMGAFYINMEDGQINFRVCQKISTEAHRGIWIREFTILAMKLTDMHFKKMKEFATEE